MQTQEKQIHVIQRNLCLENRKNPVCNTESLVWSGRILITSKATTTVIAYFDARISHGKPTTAWSINTKSLQEYNPGIIIHLHAYASRNTPKTVRQLINDEIREILRYHVTPAITPTACPPTSLLI